VKCYIWNIALYGPETLALRKVSPRCLGSFKCGAGGKREWRNWPDRVKNIPYSQGGKENSRYIKTKEL